MKTLAPTCFTVCLLVGTASAQQTQVFNVVPNGIHESTVPRFPDVRDRDLLYRPDVDHAYTRDLLFRPEIDASRVLRVEPDYTSTRIAHRMNLSRFLVGIQEGGFDPQTGNFDRPMLVLDSPDESGNPIDK
ncbi:MAG: hypothetical protein AAGD00_02285 [Planctomycetota bacterium]